MPSTLDQCSVCHEDERSAVAYRDAQVAPAYRRRSLGELGSPQDLNADRTTISITG